MYSVRLLTGYYAPCITRDEQTRVRGYHPEPGSCSMQAGLLVQHHVHIAPGESFLGSYVIRTTPTIR
jgi:hypothetical protein